MPSWIITMEPGRTSVGTPVELENRVGEAEATVAHDHVTRQAADRDRVLDRLPQQRSGCPRWLCRGRPGR